MATIAAAQGTMGQSGQRTLLPFFGKGFGNSGMRTPDAQGSDIPTSETEPIRQHPQLDPNASLENDQSIQDTHSQPPLPPENGDKRSSRTKSPSTGSTALIDETEGSRRRKRRKTGIPSVLDSEDVDEQPSVVPEQCPAPASENPKNQLDTAGDGSMVGAGPSSNPVPESTPHSGTPKRKTMRLNPNGKLLSSPSGGNTGEETSSRQSLRVKNKTEKENVPRSKFALLEYSTDRESTGGLINDIMAGRTRYEAPSQRSAARYPNKEPPKAVHPFFLAKAPQKKAQEPQETSTATSSVTDTPKYPPFATKPLQQHSSLLGNATESNLMTPSKPSSRTNTRKLADSLEPIWPPRGIVHVRGSSLPGDRHATASRPWSNVRERKAKTSVLNVPRSESILSVPPSGRGSEFDFSERVLRHPDQVRSSGGKLKDLTVKKLSAAPNSVDGTDPSAHPVPSKPATVHPAIATLISSLPNTASSFERGEYDDLPWVQKYAPKSADHVLQLGPEALMLRAWLQAHEVSAVNTGHKNAADPKSAKKAKSESGAKRKRKQKKPKDLDQFIVSSSDEDSQMDELPGPTDDEEDELAGGVTLPHKRTVVRSHDLPHTAHPATSSKRVANAALLSGPSGCGKTAAVYAVAPELGFEVFEVNAGSRRSARDVIGRVGDMTQNHLVKILNQIDGGCSTDSISDSSSSVPGRVSEGQNTMNNFFKAKENREHQEKSAAHLKPTDESKTERSQKQSLILIEEVDVLFEQDKQFWSGVIALLSQSKRPIIMTCNDENLVPVDDLALHAIFRFHPPLRDLAVDYTLLVAAKEGHVLDRQPVSDLYAVLRRDLRATVMQVDFWCQMAVGSKKSGLDWLINRPSLPAQNSCSDLPRAVSWGTYTEGMGWYSQDLSTNEQDSFDRRFQLMMDCLDQWSISVTDWHEAKKTPNYDGLSRIDSVIQESDIADVRSDMDILCREDQNDPTKDTLDFSAPMMSGKERSNYTEAYHLLQADRKPDFTCLPTTIGAAMSVLLEECFETGSSLENEQTIVSHILETSATRRRSFMSPVEFPKAFDPLLESADASMAYSGHRPLSFTRGIDVIAEDIAPYIRTIVAFDARLEQRRSDLSGFVTQDSRGNKRIRTTRASRAALEGGDKATTRRERWFPGGWNSARILATGGLDWQDLLLDQNADEVSELPQRNDRESSSEGGT